VGLFTGLLTLPLAPVRGVVWVAEQIMEETERQFYDEAAIRGELLELEFAAERDGLSPEEIRTREDALLTRLAVGQARRQAESRGMQLSDVETEGPYG